MIEDQAPATVSPEITHVQLGDKSVTWGGTDLEADELIAAVDLFRACPGQNCLDNDDITFEPDGLSDCPSHMMLYDQRTLNGLLMVRRSRDHWIRREWRDD
jgi:hypothetical protein